MIVVPSHTLLSYSVRDYGAFLTWDPTTDTAPNWPLHRMVCSGDRGVRRLGRQKTLFKPIIFDSSSVAEGGQEAIAGWFVKYALWVVQRWFQPLDDAHLILEWSSTSMYLSSLKVV